jgi:hypothetical protein
MVKKLSKKNPDISFLDPKTMEVRCTFNQCINKFTIEGFDVQVGKFGNEFVTAYHQCCECGQKVKVRGDGSRAYKLWLARKQEQEIPQDNEDTNEF